MPILVNCIMTRRLQARLISCGLKCGKLSQHTLMKYTRSTIELNLSLSKFLIENIAQPTARRVPQKELHSAKPPTIPSPLPAHEYLRHSLTSCHTAAQPTPALSISSCGASSRLTFLPQKKKEATKERSSHAVLASNVPQNQDAFERGTRAQQSAPQ